MHDLAVYHKPLELSLPHRAFCQGSAGDFTLPFFIMLSKHCVGFSEEHSFNLLLSEKFLFIAVFFFFSLNKLFVTNIKLGKCCSMIFFLCRKFEVFN